MCPPTVWMVRQGGKLERLHIVLDCLVQRVDRCNRAASYLAAQRRHGGIEVRSAGGQGFVRWY